MLRVSTNSMFRTGEQNIVARQRELLEALAPYAPLPLLVHGEKGFELIEDTYQPEQDKRWVLVAPPGNPEGGFLQNATLVGITSSPTLQFERDGVTLKMDNLTEFVGPSSRQVPRVEAKDTDVVFVGYGIDAPELGHDDYAGVDVRGIVRAALQNFQSGEIVSGEGHVVCGRCRNCMAGRRHLCDRSKGIGVHRDGAFAQYLVLPASNVWVHRISLDLDVAAPGNSEVMRAKLDDAA